jgi:hypothetical protein
MADKTTVDNPEVGTLDTFLSENTAENTVENTGQNEINSTKPDKASRRTSSNVTRSLILNKRYLRQR